jgi:hypothetical protein
MHLEFFTQIRGGKLVKEKMAKVLAKPKLMKTIKPYIQES